SCPDLMTRLLRAWRDLVRISRTPQDAQPLPQTDTLAIATSLHGKDPAAFTGVVRQVAVAVHDPVMQEHNLPGLLDALLACDTHIRQTCRTGIGLARALGNLGLNGLTQLL